MDKQKLFKLFILAMGNYWINREKLSIEKMKPDSPTVLNDITMIKENNLDITDGYETLETMVSSDNQQGAYHPINQEDLVITEYDSRLYSEKIAVNQNSSHHSMNQAPYEMMIKNKQLACIKAQDSNQWGGEHSINQKNIMKNESNYFFLVDMMSKHGGGVYSHSNGNINIDSFIIGDGNNKFNAPYNNKNHNEESISYASNKKIGQIAIGHGNTQLSNEMSIIVSLININACKESHSVDNPPLPKEVVNPPLVNPPL